MRTGENIYKRKDGRWEARYKKGRNTNGRIIYGFCYGRTYSEAKNKMENAKKQDTAVATCASGEKTIPHFGEICDEWMQTNHLRLKPSTTVKYQTIINKHIRPALGAYALSEITAARVGVFGSDLLTVHGLASKTAKDIRDGKIKRWEKRQIQSNCLQGILQGESIPEIAERISNVTMQEAKSTIRYARTMTTGAENAGRIDSYKRAENKGIEIEQQWLATLDNRTREEHRDMDGEHVKIGEKFSNGCEYPGDPSGDPGEVWNCRCTLIPLLIGNDNEDVTDLSERESSKLEGMSYSEWKKAKPKYEPIEKQKKTSEAIKQKFISQYKETATRLKDVKL